MADKRDIFLTAIVVRDYDEAIRWYVDVLGFVLHEDTPLTPNKRWVVVGPPHGARLLLAKGVGAEQTSRIGNQTGGRVFMFMHTDDIERDYAAMSARGVTFARPIAEQEYGKVAVFADLYGNLWDLIEPPT
jgi:catechol 2,3-dioxygenase-like lactoylglutathione lyase family enzyme